jgi:hypothetical protein
MPWAIKELKDDGKQQWYRYHVVGWNTEAVIPESFSWAVPDIDDPRFVLHTDAPAMVRDAFKSAKRGAVCSACLAPTYDGLCGACAWEATHHE